MSADVVTFDLADLTEGASVVISRSVTEAEIDAFAAFSGDINPIHMDAAFARARGFKDRVAHGMLLAAYVSMGIGTRLPGANSLLHGMDLKFLAPTYPGDGIQIKLTVGQVSQAVKVAVLKIEIHNARTGVLLARGKAQVGVRRQTEREAGSGIS